MGSDEWLRFVPSDDNLSSIDVTSLSPSTEVSSMCSPPLSGRYGPPERSGIVSRGSCSTPNIGWVSIWSTGEQMMCT